LKNISVGFLYPKIGLWWLGFEARSKKGGLIGLVGRNPERFLDYRD